MKCRFIYFTRLVGALNLTMAYRQILVRQTTPWRQMLTRDTRSPWRQISCLPTLLCQVLTRCLTFNQLNIFVLPKMRLVLHLQGITHGGTPGAAPGLFRPSAMSSTSLANSWRSCRFWRESTTWWPPASSRGRRTLASVRKSRSPV